MNVLHISTMSKGGSYLAVSRLNEELNTLGINSKILVLEETSDLSCTIPYIRHSNSFIYSVFFKLTKSILYRFNIGIGKFWRLHDRIRKNNECIYSYPISLYRVEKHPLVKQWADIVHLHWCDNFINYPTFFSSVKQPIVWTLHDISFKYGGFHFEIDYLRLKKKYYELEKRLKEIKEDALKDKYNITLIALSLEIKKEIESVPYLSSKTIVLLPNIIDSNNFDILDKDYCRKILNLPDKKIILFISENVDTESKGLNDLRKALSNFNPDGIMLCAIGNHNKNIANNDTFHSLYTGKITDRKMLNQYYSAADLLVIPSYQESFSQSFFEALACGIPVVAYPCGAIPEYINEYNGVLCNKKNPIELKKCIEEALCKKYDPSAIRTQIVSKLSPSVIGKKYLKLYIKISE